ncbi:methylenetetrahydrofolate reductase isoform X2 [Odontomachus brunneus]|uniref:methylenetetrahydrofolate reductase isoform X2 n=1 Tax=Odontomachus brunneus TaxID=486640 RepID=UPI0013F20CFA|nr:methylenetetrahydrofolate reductase isoform X2 [Odontomachus brunneus]
MSLIRGASIYSFATTRRFVMRNFVFVKDSDTDRNDAEDDSPTCSFRTENCHREIIDLRRLLRDKTCKHEIFCSFEVVSRRKPDISYQRLLAEMDKYSPLFYALTWHNEEVFANKNYLPLEVLENFPSNTLLHLAANGLRRDEIVSILRRALSRGIINIFALQGDSSSKDGDFVHASDLVTFIREQFGDTFCICVAGYPQMHPKSASKELDLHYLKAKVEAGADFIITQIIFESQVFIDFVKDCREIGIQVPIIPGIFVPTNYECLELMARVCKLDIPEKIKHDLSRMRNEDKVMRKFVLELTVQIITDVIGSGTTCGFHLFTLNRLSLLAEICGHINSCKQTI